MRNHHALGTSIEHARYPFGAVVRHAHQGADARQERRLGQLRRRLEGQRRVLEVEKQRLVAGELGYRDNLHCSYEPDRKR